MCVPLLHFSLLLASCSQIMAVNLALEYLTCSGSGASDESAPCLQGPILPTPYSQSLNQCVFLSSKRPTFMVLEVSEYLLADFLSLQTWEGHSIQLLLDSVHKAHFCKPLKIHIPRIFFFLLEYTYLKSCHHGISPYKLWPIFRWPFSQYIVLDALTIWLQTDTPIQNKPGSAQCTQISKRIVFGTDMSLQCTGLSQHSQPLAMATCMLRTQGRCCLIFSTCSSTWAWQLTSSETWLTLWFIRPAEPETL